GAGMSSSRTRAACRPFPPAPSTAHLNTLGGLATRGWQPQQDSGASLRRDGYAVTLSYVSRRPRMVQPPSPRGAAPPGFVAGGHGDEVSDRPAGFRAQPEDRAELLGVDARIADRGQQFDLILQQAGLLLVELREEEGGRHAEGPGHRLDQAHLRVLCLAIAQFPDLGVGDLLAGGLLDQVSHLVVGVGAPAGGLPPFYQPVHLVRQRVQRERAPCTIRSLTWHHCTSLDRTAHHLISMPPPSVSHSS